MSDYNFLMESRLSPEEFRAVNHLSRIASSQGVNLYLVGGVVRDLTLGQRAVRDLDFVVEGNIQKVLRQLTSPVPPKPHSGEPRMAPSDGSGLKVEHTELDDRRNSAQVLFADGLRAEIASSRNEVYAKPGGRPEIEPASIFEDLKRRDFSVNAMAISLHPNSRGLLLDPTNGAADIERRELRALHSRSFLDDPLRLYRLLRLAQRLDFQIEERTQRWFESALESRAWESLDPEQQGRELAAILQEVNCARVLRMLKDRGLLGGLDRKLGSMKISYDRFARIRAAVRNIPGADVYLLNVHALIEKLPPAQKSLLARKIFGFGKLANSVLNLDHDARKLAQTLGGPKAAKPSQVYALLDGAPRPLLLFLLVHYKQAKIQSRLKSFFFKFPAVRAALPRAQLRALGMEPGPKFEKALHQIFLDQLDGKIRTHPQLQKALHEYSGIRPPEPPRPASQAKPESKRAAKKRAAQSGKPQPVAAEVKERKDTGKGRVESKGKNKRLDRGKPARGMKKR